MANPATLPLGAVVELEDSAEGRRHCRPPKTDETDRTALRSSAEWAVAATVDSTGAGAMPPRTLSAGRTANAAVGAAAAAVAADSTVRVAATAAAVVGPAVALGTAVAGAAAAVARSASSELHPP